jgi:hypothetical protein
MAGVPTAVLNPGDGMWLIIDTSQHSALASVGRFRGTHAISKDIRRATSEIADAWCITNPCPWRELRQVS